MLVKDFINKDIHVLNVCDTAEYALSLMDDWKLKQLPVATQTGLFQGLVDEKRLLELSQPTSSIEEVQRQDVSIGRDQSLHEAMHLLVQYGLTLLPVVTSEGYYLGAVTQEGLLRGLTEWIGADREGSVIVLDVDAKDYSLVELARLVESNNAHVLSVLTQVDPDTGRYHVALKIDLVDASPVLRCFERFHYAVSFYFMEHGMVDEQLRCRMSELLYYMNM